MRKQSFQRRDATGHLEPKYAADLRSRIRRSSSPPEDVAFLARAKSLDPLAEALGEEFLATATTGEAVAVEELNQIVPEDEGGPFVTTPARKEFARGRDASNPRGSTREPFPTALGSDGEDQD
ncbi:MAG TPA: hypothetical protein VKU41_11075 [Polyangiaceae bacterium]|nr:hypothetical protein [Polyangiaceae bacterium]